MLFEIRINAHIAHLQTTSFSKHKALDELYNDIVEFTDRYVETYQGINSILYNYDNFKLSEGVDFVSYLKDKIVLFREFRSLVLETELQAIIDELLEFLNSIVYKLMVLQ